jgi:hypothetical protein
VRTLIIPDSSGNNNVSVAEPPASAKPDAPSVVETPKKDETVVVTPVVEAPLAEPPKKEEAPAWEEPVMVDPEKVDPLAEEAPATENPIEEIVEEDVPTTDAPIEAAAVDETPTPEAPKENKKSQRPAIVLVVVAMFCVTMLSFLFWYNSPVQKGARRFDSLYGTVEQLNALPSISIYHFDGKWLVRNYGDLPRTLLQYDPIDSDPLWVQDGLEILKNNPDTTDKQALFAAYFEKYASSWETARKNTCAVLGKALFENTANFNEEELERIEICFKLYATDCLAMS